jgi:hypothetical protein
MRRAISVAAFVASAAAGLAAQTAWTTFTSQDTSASFVAPCLMKGNKTETAKQNGQPAHTDYLYICTAADEMYVFGLTDYEAGYTFDNDAELKANRDNLVKGLEGATLLTSDGITYAGLRGLEFTVNWANTSKLVTSRVFMVGRRPYMLAVATPLNQNRSENIRRFLASFSPPK